MTELARSRRPIFSLLAGAAALVPAGVQAQADAGLPDGDESDDEVIIVTAQGREQRLQDVPISVSVTTGEAIQKSNLIDLQAVSAAIPTVHISPGPGADNIKHPRRRFGRQCRVRASSLDFPGRCLSQPRPLCTCGIV